MHTQRMHARATRGLKSRLGRATALPGAPLELSEKDSMARTRKLAQGMEHRQDFHLVFISHLDQDFKVRSCACLSVFCLCLCLLMRCSQVACQYSTFRQPFEHCDVQRNGTLTLPMASRIQHSVPGLADPSTEICDPHCVAFKYTLRSCRHFAAALLSSSGALRTWALHHNFTTQQPNTSNPSLRQHPPFTYASFQHSPVS
jgi:hypothetical protein